MPIQQFALESDLCAALLRELAGWFPRASAPVAISAEVRVGNPARRRAAVGADAGALVLHRAASHRAVHPLAAEELATSPAPLAHAVGLDHEAHARA